MSGVCRAPERLRLPDLHQARHGIGLAPGVPLEALEKIVEGPLERRAPGLVLLLLPTTEGLAEPPVVVFERVANLVEC